MTPAFALFFALLAPQAATPATPPFTDPPAAQSSPTPTPATPSTDHAAPTTPSVHQIGGSVTPPKVIYQPEADYTKAARKKKITGVATVSLIVDAQGNPVNVHIIKSIADKVDEKRRAAALTLDQSAIDNVKKYRFEPAMENGKPIAVYLNVEVDFQLF
jgi:protein TonB